MRRRVHELHRLKQNIKSKVVQLVRAWPIRRLKRLQLAQFVYTWSASIIMGARRLLVITFLHIFADDSRSRKYDSALDRGKLKA